MSLLAVLNTGEDHESKGTGVASGAIVKGRPVKWNAVTMIFEECDALGEVSDGVPIHDAAAGETFTFVRKGRVLMIANAAITAGVDVSVAATGKVTTSLTTHAALGRALTAAGADGDEILVDYDNKAYYTP